MIVAAFLLTVGSISYAVIFEDCGSRGELFYINVSNNPSNATKANFKRDQIYECVFGFSTKHHYAINYHLKVYLIIGGVNIPFIVSD